MLFKKLLLLGTVSASLLFTACDDDDDAVIDNVNQADRTFVSNATMINNSQIALGELAQTRSVNDSVIMYGQMLAEEHTVADAELDSLATTLNISYPDSLDATMIALRDRLAGLNGYDFDTAFINAQLAGHSSAIAQFETQVNTGSNANIRAYANKYLSAIRNHRAFADSVSNNLE